MKNFLAVLFVIVTQFGCAAYWSMDKPATFGEELEFRVRT